MNIREKFLKINEKIENIKEWQWLLITFCICLLAIILISPQIIWQPFIHAEDGPIFLRGALENGVSSLFKTFGGYLGVLPRGFAIIAIAVGRKFNSYIAVTFVMKTLSTLFSVLAVNYFNSNEFKKFIGNRGLRLLISLLLMFVMANHENMLYTSIMAHWWGDLLILFVGYSFLNKKMPPLYIFPLVILVILSSPVALVISVPILYYIIFKFKENRDSNIKQIISQNKWKIIALILTIISIVAEIYAIIVLAKGADYDTFNQSHMNALYMFHAMQKALKAVAECIPYILTMKKLPIIMQENIRVILGTVILLIMIWRYYKNRSMKMFLWGLLTMLTIYFLAYFKQNNFYKHPSETFYSSVPATVGVLLIVKFLYDNLKVILRDDKFIYEICIALILITMNIIYFKHTYKPVYKFCNLMNQIEARVDFNSKKKERISISDKDRMES